MIARTHEYTVDLDTGTIETRWDNPLTCGDKSADKIVVTLTRGNEAATLSGLTVILFGVLNNGTTAFKSGTIEENVVTVEMDYPFYAIPGPLELLLQLAEGTTVVNTPLRISTYVKFGPTDEMVSTGEQFSLAALQAIAAACETATNLANSASTSANDAAGAANTAKDNAQDAADAITGITAEATAVDPGQLPTAAAETDPEDGHINIVFGIPTGLTGLRGARPWYGTDITGTSSVPTAYATGLASVNAGDTYIYTGTNAANVGNEYVCTLGGDAATALWIFLRNSRGIPGSGSVSTVDSVNPDGNGNAQIDAVRFTSDQSATYNDTQKTQARNNIGAASVTAVNAKASGITHTATLPTSGWSGTGPYTYAANVSDVTASNTVFAGPAPASRSAYNDCGAYPSAQGAGTLTFTAESVPTSEITVNVIVLNL